MYSFSVSSNLRAKPTTFRCCFERDAMKRRDAMMRRDVRNLISCLYCCLNASTSQA